MVGQSTGELLVELVPAGDVVHQHDARERPVALGPGNVGMDRVAVATGERLNPGALRHVRIGPERVPHIARTVPTRASSCAQMCRRAAPLRWPPPAPRAPRASRAPLAPPAPAPALLGDAVPAT